MCTMSDQLREINRSLKKIRDTLKTGNVSIKNQLPGLREAIKRAKGTGFKGWVFKMYDKLQGLFGKDFSGRDQLKRDLRQIASDIHEKSEETASLISDLVDLSEQMPESSGSSFTDMCLL